MDIVSEFKKGYRTSEFWVGLATVFGPFLTLVLGKEFDTEGAVALIGMVFGGATYVGGRTWLKTKRLTAVATVATSVNGHPVEAELLERTNVEVDAIPVDAHEGPPEETR